MASKQRSLRAKVSFDDPDEEEHHAVVAPARPKVQKPASKPSLLSFGGDEEPHTVSKKLDAKKPQAKSKFLRAPSEAIDTSAANPSLVGIRSGNGE